MSTHLHHAFRIPHLNSGQEDLFTELQVLRLSIPHFLIHSQNEVSCKAQLSETSNERMIHSRRFIFLKAKASEYAAISENGLYRWATS